ncbi:S-adenosylmethionine:tRNA ribosyltransferase-isomerase [Mechercharimyces sp. CAU 1602]|uniref:S-adenosylmethionine:tRNA ribosyltransferase-isomerase n=1 Tax=Mechercharimyces sp. CAU 1602 TaxID=2973933 RepID=UPI0021615931|nr:S-adenosylmethionine:tRNA ribosyltransferase-isomerase [Mechercharimyces sp. CAU 1602]MCS1350766.1 S-adenosylmethionine:tRNA ribosyltransferase-isomerase [Mechercharimyces sp. CAU 1602]
MNNATHSNFTVPAHLHAAIPPEIRGDGRDHVRMMVIEEASGKITDTHFKKLSSFLRSGDLIVFNNSRTLPAHLPLPEGYLRLSQQVSDHEWDVLIQNHPAQIGTRFQWSPTFSATITGTGSEPPLKRLSFSLRGAALIDSIYRYGQPIRYEYVKRLWELPSYQTVYATKPGSVEMPSAGRAFTWKMMHTLQKRNIGLAFLTLHAGLSYYEGDHWPQPSAHPEFVQLTPATAALINQTKAKGGRVIAVGTTVVRAIESAINKEGEVIPYHHFTDLYIKENHSLHVVDGLLTGFHEPEASHLEMLSAFIPQRSLFRAYEHALKEGYLWHEFGDLNLILP